MKTKIRKSLPDKTGPVPTKREQRLSAKLTPLFHSRSEEGPTTWPSPADFLLPTTLTQTTKKHDSISHKLLTACAGRTGRFITARPEPTRLKR